MRYGDICRLRCIFSALLLHDAGWDERESEAAVSSCNFSPGPPAPATHGICKATAHIKKPAAPANRGDLIASW